MVLLLLPVSIYVYAGCSSSPAYTKGDCEFGQICDNGKCEWADRDFDGYPNYKYCRKLPDGSHNCDCDDSDPEVHPGAPERCNYKDDNCNGVEVTTNMDSCTDHRLWAYYYGYMAYTADCGIKDAVYVGHYCERGSGSYTDYGNYIRFVCSPAPKRQDNLWLWKCCDYIVTETGEGIDEGDVCQKTVHVCDEKPFYTTSKGQGQTLSIGSCDGKTWCKDETAIRDEATCQYTAQEDYLGINEFNTYFCDKNDCYKFVKGTFQICGFGWQCTAVCFPGECNFETKEWCNNAGIWQTEDWCHSRCGRSDSECGGNCKQGVCDLNAKKVCNNNGYWVSENYCNCDVCGSKDSSCTTMCKCENDFCDIQNQKYCDNGIWNGYGYFLFKQGKCCEEDYDGHAIGYACECDEMACDTTHNRFCSEGTWVYNIDTYCSEDICGPYDFDCGSEPCANGNCDIVKDLYCDNGEWISLEKPQPYCFPGYCGLKDTECGCTNQKDNCCLGKDDETCDFDCMVSSDPDCLVCETKQGDCCNDSPRDGCDKDCIPGVDPDCQEDCSIKSDDCCSGLDDGICDPDCTENSDIDCVGYCTNSGGDCCVPDNDGICDPDCIPGVDPNCAAHPCEENWNCSGGWDKLCDGVHTTHTCQGWEDLNGCNTFYDKPDETQNCYKEFTCEPADDTDKDGYPRRACYDAKKGVVLDELDCDDNDASQNPKATEVCNGEDDDCDGSIDEGCPCVGGATQSCGKNVGICKSGLQLCTGGYWGLCGGSGYAGPTKEVCEDGLDNNCDGYIDENCVCVQGDTQDCGSDIGICKKGWQACYNNVFGSVCNEEIKGGTEICNDNLDNDCDGFLDGEDSNCQVSTPVTTGPEHCRNRIQDAGETGIDCGDNKDCPPCSDKPPGCSYGEIKSKCTCGAAAYTKGYCCNGKYSLAECAEPVRDSDGDGCTDDRELQLGTNPLVADTDGDGLLDCDPDEKYPLCNEDGFCDSEREYPETLENCPADCGTGLGWITWLILILIILVLLGVGGYFYAKKKGYNIQDLLKKIKLSNFIKIKKKEKEEKPVFQYFKREEIQKPEPSNVEDIQPATKSVRPNAKPVKKSTVQLMTFVNSSLRKGYTKLQIREAALKEGWSKEEIDQLLKGKKSTYKFK